MNRTASLFVAALVASQGMTYASSVAADDQLSPTRIGVGFHGTRTSLGVRWWLGEKIALDAGFGTTSQDFGGDELTRITGDLGVPFRLASWDRVGVHLRPGIEYSSEEVPTGYFGSAGTNHVLTASLRFEAEVFLVSRVSLSGSFGVAFENNDAATGGTVQTWSTTGGNFTDVGFHVYFGGPR
jgi:hypothetical protein